MDSEHYATNALPGTYNYDGFFMNVAIPGTKEKIKTKIPAQHIAYNIILPKICKEINSENFRECIRYQIPSVRFSDGEAMAEYVNEADSKNPKHVDFGKSKQIVLGKMCKSLPAIAKYICAETGHAMSIDVFDLPRNTEILEYYDYLAQKIGEDIFSGTSFSFDVDSEIATSLDNFERLIEKKDENFYCIKKMENQLIKTSENTTPGSIKKLKELYEDSEIAKANLEKVLKICENDCSDKHARGYSMAEIMHKNFEGNAFKHHVDIFTTRDRKIFIRPYIEKNLPANDRDLLRDANRKIDYIQKSVKRGYPKAHANKLNMIKEYLENIGIEPINPYVEG